jgi:hypothetical protein
MQSEQYLLKKETPEIPLSIYTSYDACFPLHESHDMALRLFITSEIDSILVVVTVDRKPDIEVIGNRQSGVHKFSSIVFYIVGSRLYS